MSSTIRSVSILRDGGLSQAELAERVGVKQANISRIEGRDDLKVSTLAKVVAAMGATLSIRARFPDGRSGNWSSDRPAPILTGSSRSRQQESPAIPKRKPPSQRPERQMDDTARAIARLQEEAKAEKAAEARKGESTSAKRQVPQSVNGMGRRQVGGPTPQTSTKRPKTGGA